jgi:hypothetical protein
VWVTANPEESLAASVLAGLPAAAGKERSRVREITALVDRATFSLGVPGVAKAAVEVRRPEGTTAVSAAAAFKEAVAETVAAITGDGGTGIAIFIDEIQSADPESLRAIAYAWQELASEKPMTPAAVFAAGLPNSSEAISAAVTFAERFEYRALAPLEDSDVALALAAPAQQLGVRWSPAALQSAVENASGFPYKVQLIGHEAWTSAGWPEPGGEIDDSHVRRALVAVDEQMRELFRARWGSATPAERDVLVAIARLGGHDVKREDIATALGKSSIALSVPRARLLQKGIIETSRYGYLSFSVPGFTDYLLDIEEGEG